MIEVRVHSVWQDMDPRCKGRTFRIDAVAYRAGVQVALCTILTNIEGAVTDRVGGKTTIAVGRFVPANYTLIREGP